MLALVEGIGATASKEPDPEQALAVAIGLQNLVVIAPAGSGKTDVLAQRAESLIVRRLVVWPRQVLALTFTNRAVDNLTARLRSTLGVQFRRHVDVSNFHGFAARVLRAHGTLIGLDAGKALWPSDRRTQAALQEVGAEFSEPVKAALRRAKSDPVPDSEVLERLRQSAPPAAVAFEERRQSEGRLDNDDLIHLADCLLQDERVANCYRNRFPVVMVDEAQDLTVQQFRLVERLSDDRLTAAGDRTQSIFRFAGADVDRVFRSLADRKPAIVKLARSYRSAPAVLRVVNALGSAHQALALECADPTRFRDEGVVAILHRPDALAEAHDLLSQLQSRGLTDGDESVGVLIRAGQRGAQLDAACRQRDIPMQRWTMPTHTLGVVRLVRRYQAGATGGSDLERLAALQQACQMAAPADDVDLCSDLQGAFELMSEQVAAGMSWEEIVSSCRATGSRDQPIGPGLHLLNAHRGKGQQFDWVVVLGAEEGKIPWYRAEEDSDEMREEQRIFGVMISRARYGLVLTHVDREVIASGQTFVRTPTRWLAQVQPHITEEW